MFEVFYSLPPNKSKEGAVAETVASFGGRLGYRESINGDKTAAVCLSFEFDNLEQAEAAATLLRGQGEHVEGPMEYGPSPQ
jgi:hypothetical protein